MGAGLLAKAVGQSIEMSTDPPPSRASPLPHWFCGALQVGCPQPLPLVLVIFGPPLFSRC
ncbi:hypothetical protein C1X87_10730 [Pseudomonas sp. GP01-A14]|nr:hypothetical protein C1X87_10730 [Pseudomonas sp. GP01-A14]PMU84675.1 hypothetical protein C1X91_03455 [Pseudomonas sp. GP01-A5]PMV09115.1 hypothetical protein C1X83_21440 [Pseudomonas sp. GP01-A4]